MNKKGFTLMELVVYMAMIGIVVLVAGQAFSNSTKFRVRTQNMLKATQEAENVANLFREDVSQMGAKSSKEANASATADSFFVATENVYMDPANVVISKRDSSSFRLVNSGTMTDTLVFRRMRYDESGHFVSVEQVRWILANSTLYRSCQVLAQASGVTFDANDPCSSKTESEPVEMATDVDSFYVEPARPEVSEGATAQLLPSTDTSVHTFRLVSRYGSNNLNYLDTDPAEGGLSISLSGFATNYDFDKDEIVEDGVQANQVFVALANSTSGVWSALCRKVSLEPDVVYEISFSMPFAENASRMFCPGRDHMAVGFRTTSGDAVPGLDDFVFYPPTVSAANGTRSMRFSVPSPVSNVCMAFTFSSYSPVAASGTVSLSEVALKKVASANYSFDGYTITASNLADKKNVKAFRLHLRINRRNETGNSQMVVPIPSNGPND